MIILSGSDDVARSWWRHGDHYVTSGYFTKFSK